MVEARRFPSRRRMAHGAVRGKIGNDMLGAHDIIVVRLMAGNTLRRRPLIPVVLMALRAGENHMGSR